MARPLRIEYEGAVYHVTSRGNERKNIFFTKRDYAKFKEYVAGAEKRFQIIVHAYVLMTNHYHLLVETPQKNLQRAMHYINSSYTGYVNTKRKRSGHLFQERFKSIVVDKDNYLIELSRYIHLNPVRAKMVEKPEEYCHSSYRGYVLGEDDGIVSTSTILRIFDDDPLVAGVRYKEFVEDALSSEVASPFDRTYRGSFLGDEDFVNDVLGNLDWETVTKNEDIANRKAIRGSMSAEAILSQLTELKRYGVKLRA